jgi:hypothetical protein
MPTIDQLAPAQAVADTDELPISQGGTVRAATRAQLVAGLQPTLALAQGQLLGRASSGSGPAETVTLGANLVLTGTTLAAAAAPFAIPELSAGTTPQPADLVPVGQGGSNFAVPYAEFMLGISSLPTTAVSALSVAPAGGTSSGTLAELFGAAISVESFGAKGDGATDDTAAFNAAVASGRPIRLSERTYIVNGQWTIATPNAVLLGVAGASILKRASQAAGNGAWIAVQADGFVADGVIFDANGAAVATDSWGVLVEVACTHSDFQRCVFRNASGATLGSGLVFQASDPAVCEHVVRDCEFASNAVHGVWVQACCGVQLLGCRAHDNGQYGIDVDFNDPTFVQKVHLVQVADCRSWNNTRGINIGNFNETNVQPPVWGNANPDAVAVIVTNNICHDNRLYGISASGFGLLIATNILVNNGSATNGGAAILGNVSYSRIAGNMITGTATYGIDCGGSISSEMTGNRIVGSTFGINCGGSLSVRVVSNMVQDPVDWAIIANNVESDGQGNNFGIACANLTIAENWIGLSSSAMGGIWLRDGPSNVIILRNVFVGTNDAVVGRCLFGGTDSMLVEGNRWNAEGRFTCNPTAVSGLQTVVFPDIADIIMLTAVSGSVQSLLSAYQAATQGEVVFIRVTSGGSGYSGASVTVGGSGSGATGQAIISGGVVIGVQVTNPGSGYGTVGAVVPITIAGDGAGASATAISGLLLSDGRGIRIQCNAPVTFARAGSNPLQENWTLSDLTVPAYGEVDWTMTFGEWRAARATP